MVSNLLNIRELTHSIGARRIGNYYNGGFSSVTIDSRSVKEGSLFFALTGNKSDGHNFVKDAFNLGARAAVVDASKLEQFNLTDIAQKAGKDLIAVENTLKSLQDSARVYLEKFPNLIKIGITGSSGKTTTKEIASSIISCEYNTVMNKGNLNSETGLPLSVFEVDESHEVGIFELGMNRKNEISEIAFVLKPNIACITNIGSAHIEFFGCKLKILNEKKSIFKFLKNGDVAIINKDDEYANQLAEGLNVRISYFGNGCFPELEDTTSLGLDGTEIIWAGEKIRFPLPGKHSLDDAMAAIAIAKEIKVSSSSIKKGLESVKPLFGRQEITKGKVTLICDCYNASPESMRKSIEFCDSIEYQGRKIFVLGDMLELGELSASIHKELGNLLACSKAEKIFLFGKEIAASYAVLSKSKKAVFYTDDMEELSSAVKSFVREGDLVLLKGSRGCALERLMSVLTGGKNDS